MARCYCVLSLFAATFSICAAIPIAANLQLGAGAIPSSYPLLAFRSGSTATTSAPSSNVENSKKNDKPTGNGSSQQRQTLSAPFDPTKFEVDSSSVNIDNLFANFNPLGQQNLAAALVSGGSGAGALGAASSEVLSGALQGLGVPPALASGLIQAGGPLVGGLLGAPVSTNPLSSALLPLTGGSAAGAAGLASAGSGLGGLEAVAAGLGATGAGAGGVLPGALGLGIGDVLSGPLGSLITGGPAGSASGLLGGAGAAAGLSALLGGAGGGDGAAAGLGALLSGAGGASGAATGLEALLGGAGGAGVAPGLGALLSGAGGSNAAVAGLGALLGGSGGAGIDLSSGLSGALAAGGAASLLGTALRAPPKKEDGQLAQIDAAVSDLDKLIAQLSAPGVDGVNANAAGGTAIQGSATPSSANSLDQAQLLALALLALGQQNAAAAQQQDQQVLTNNVTNPSAVAASIPAKPAQPTSIIDLLIGAQSRLSNLRAAQQTKALQSLAADAEVLKTIGNVLYPTSKEAKS